MSNNLSVLNPAIWEPTVQDYLNNMLVAMDVAETRFKASLQYGDTINFPQLSDVTVQNYTPGTDLVSTAMVATQSALSVNKRKAVVSTIDQFEQAQAKADYAMSIARQAAFRLANQIDKDLITTGVSGAATSANLGTLDVSSMYAVMTDAYNVLYRTNAVDGTELCAIMPTKFKGFLSQTFVANGFQAADEALRNGFVGKAHNFNVYVSNNIPFTNTLSLSVNPTAGDTLTLFGGNGSGITFAFVANGTATNAGEISIGGSAAATQAIVVDALNGTGTPGASTYIDISTDNRYFLTNNDVQCSAFAADVATVTGVGYLNASANFTSPSNTWGTEKTSILFMRKGAISLGMQLQPNLQVDPIPLQFGKYYKTGTLYGVKVFSRDALRIYRGVVNA